MEKKQSSLLSKDISRRDFMVGMGRVASGALAFMIGVNTGCVRRRGPKDSNNNGDSLSSIDLTAWVQLSSDNTLTFFNPAAEMGQGSMTALPVIFAEEMDADWNSVKIEESATDPQVYGYEGWRGKQMYTVGSLTVRSYFTQLRLAGAAARKILLQNAAEKWGLPLGELTTEAGKVKHAKSGQEMTYGEIAAFAKAPKSPPQVSEKDLKDPKDFRLIGKSFPRRDIPEKTDGSAQYSIDVHIPEMTYAMIQRTPIHGSSPAEHNGAEVKKMDGVLAVVKVDHGVGVVARDMPSVLKAMDKLEVKWKKGALAEKFDTEKAYEKYRQIAGDDSQKGRAIVSKGDATLGKDKKAKQYEAEFLADHVYHAQMEPLNAVAKVTGGEAEIWAGSQAPWALVEAVARELGISTGKVKLHRYYLGGGFGRRSYPDYVVEAALLSKEVKKPVKLIWSRQDDLQYGMYRPQCLQRLRAEVDEKGNLLRWNHTIVGDNGGKRLLQSGIDIPYYDIPHQLIEEKQVDSGLRLKHWRAVGHGFTKWAIEAFIDQIARGEGKDPYDFRRKLVKKNPKALKVLDTVAKMSNWKKKRPQGRGLGMSLILRSESLTAAVAEISLSDSGKIKVHKVWCAVDAGIVVQPDNTVAQIEGGIIHGLSSVLKESLTHKDGKIQEENFHNYHLLTIDETPEIEVEYIKTDTRPTGIGEASLPTVGGAVANAFFDLKGKSLHRMPFTPQEVKKALKKG